MSVQFSLGEFGHPLAIWGLRRLFERSQWWPPERIVAYQEQLLRQTVRHAYEQVPYYHELFDRLGLSPGDIRTVADLEALPLLTKDIVRRQFTRLQARNRSRYHPRLYRTSGTSGEPVRFLLDQPANVLEFVYYWRHWSWAGYRLGMRFAELSSSLFLRSDSLAQRVCCYQPVLGRLLLNNLSLRFDTARQFAVAIRRYRPAFLKGIASALFFFARFLKEAGILDLEFRGVFSTGELLLPAERRLIEEVFHAKVYDSYGHMERTVAISECPAGGLHVNLEYGVMELQDKRATAPDPSEAPAAPRFTGQVVGTTLHNRSMPLLRYALGDRVEVEEPSRPCPCGRNLPLIRRLNGRQEDAILTPDGRVVTALFTLFEHVPGVALGQILQEDLRRLVVRLVPTAEYTATSETQLRRYLRRFVGPEMKFEVHTLSAEALRRQSPAKFRTVLSRLGSGTAISTSLP